MGRDIELRCKCGEIRGVVRGVSRSTVNRVVCYCADCQAFLHHLGRADLLDARGGTDITQVAPAAMTLDTGTDRVTALRFSPKGPFRWYASCCKTPLGNTVLPTMPFVGIPPELFAGLTTAKERDEVFGPPIGAIWGKYAVGGAPPGVAQGMSVGVAVRSLRRFAGWRLGGQSHPHPYFERGAKTARYPVTIVSREDRDALRAKCGPKPTAGSSSPQAEAR